jgi:hypothetical protein
VVFVCDDWELLILCLSLLNLQIRCFKGAAYL